MIVQTKLDRGTVLQSKLKIWDQTAYKSVRSCPVSLLSGCGIEQSRVTSFGTLQYTRPGIVKLNLMSEIYIDKGLLKILESMVNMNDLTANVWDATEIFRNDSHATITSKNVPHATECTKVSHMPYFSPTLLYCRNI